MTLACRQCCLTHHSLPASAEALCLHVLKEQFDVRSLARSQHVPCMTDSLTLCDSYLATRCRHPCTSWSSVHLTGPQGNL
jgi:hypothetical protein